MKVRIEKKVSIMAETDVMIDQEVDVDLEDIVAGFFAAAHELQIKSPMNTRCPQGVVGELNALVDGITQVLARIPDECIAQLSLEMRRHHRRRLGTQADRYTRLEHHISWPPQPVTEQ